MKIINLTKELKDKAREMESEVLENLKKTPNYTGFSISNRFYVGFLGELVFEQLLINSGKKYSYDVLLDGNSQGSDFKISAHRELSVEVKASDHPNAQRLLIPAKQYDYKTSDLYVGIKLSETEATIFGYCFKKQFYFAPEGFNDNKIPTYYMPFDKLFPIEDLLMKLN